MDSEGIRSWDWTECLWGSAGYVRFFNNVFDDTDFVAAAEIYYFKPVCIYGLLSRVTLRADCLI